jgi:hypothetical protein
MYGTCTSFGKDYKQRFHCNFSWKAKSGERFGYVYENLSSVGTANIFLLSECS